MRLLLLFLLAAFGCSSVDVEAARQSLIERGLHYEAALEVVTAWEATYGEDIPARCFDALAGYTIVYMSDDQHMPCDGDGAPVFRGCVDPNVSTIYLRASLPAEQQLKSAKHEWLHALGWCAWRDVDPDHTDSSRWGAEGVLEQAVSP